MAVIVPTSGAVIAPGDITGAYQDVRAVVNAETTATMLAEALGYEHLPSIVVGKDKVDFTTAITISTSPATLENVANIIATWQDPAALYVNNGGAGYSLPACILFYWCTLRMGSFASAVAMRLDHQVWANLYYIKGGVDQTTNQNSRLIYGQLPTAGDQKETEDTITIFDVVEEAAALTLNRIGVRFALNRGVSIGAVPSFTVENGQVGFMALYRKT